MNKEDMEIAKGWLMDDLHSAREDDPSVGIFCNEGLAEVFEYLIEHLDAMIEARGK